MMPVRTENISEQPNRKNYMVQVSLGAWLFVLLLLYIGITPVYDFGRTYLDFPRLGINLIVVIGFAVWILLNMNSGLNINMTGTYFLVFLLLCTIAVYQIVAYPRVSGYEGTSFLTYFTLIIFSFFFFAVGTNIVSVYEEWKKTRWRNVCYFIYGFILVCVILAIINNGISSPNIIERLIIIPSGAETEFNYLRFADFFAMYTLMLISWEIRPLLRYAVMFSSLVVLFAINSRTTFFLVLVIMVIFMFNRLHAVWKGLMIALILLALAFTNVSSLQDFAKESASQYSGTAVYRMFRLVDMESDTSYKTRQAILQQGLIELRKDWLLGKGYKGEIETLGRGAYIHNWLSFWYCYGFFPFILFCALSIKLIFSTYFLWVQRRNDPVISFVFMYSILAFLSIILARSYLFTNIWFCLAAMALITSPYSELDDHYQ